MIRAAQPHDLPVLSALWLDTNLEAHAFIDAAFFTDRLSLVTMAFSRAEIYICTDTDSLIRGFIGLDGEKVAGLFVRQGCRGAGVGKALLDTAKSLRARLTLSVYDLNPGRFNSICARVLKPSVTGMMKTVRPTLRSLYGDAES